MKLRELRGEGQKYPRVLREEVLARAIPQIERFLPAGPDPLVPFEDDEEIPMGFRFPSPRGLQRVLSGGSFILTVPGVDAAFFGDLDTAFAYPWVREFGTVALFDPVALSTYRVRARPGWFVCDGAQSVDEQDFLYVPTQSMAVTLQVGSSREEAIEQLGAQNYRDAVQEKRAAIEQYVQELPALDATAREYVARAKMHPDGVREELEAIGVSLQSLEGPLFVLSFEQRKRLLAR